MDLLFHRGTATLDKRRVKIMYDLIIIGSGPAGCQLQSMVRERD